MPEAPSTTASAPPSVRNKTSVAPSPVDVGGLYARDVQARQSFALRLASHLEVDLLRPQAGTGTRHGGYASNPGDDEVPPPVSVKIGRDEAANPLVRLRQVEIEDYWSHHRIGNGLAAQL